MDKVSWQASPGLHGLGVTLLGRSELLRGIYENIKPWKMETTGPEVAAHL